MCMDRDKTADKAGRCNDSGRKSHGMELSSAARVLTVSRTVEKFEAVPVRYPVELEQRSEK